MKQIFYQIVTILIGFSCLSITPTQAQDNTIDSLLVELQAAKQDTQKVNVIIELSKNYYPADLKMAAKYADEGLRLASSLNFKSGVANASYAMAKIQNKLNSPQKALNLYDKALDIYEILGNQRQLANALNNVGIIHKNQGQYLKALTAYERAYGYFQIIKDFEGSGNTLINMGNLSRRLGNHKKAAEHYFQALNLFDSLGSKSQIASIYANLGNLYKDQHDYDKSLKYHLEAKELFEELDNKNALARVLNNVGLIYEEQLKFDQALEAFEQSYQTFSQLNIELGMGSALGNIANIYDQKEDYKAALSTYRKALKIFEEIQGLSNIADIYTSMGSVFTKRGEFKSATEHLEKGLTIAKEISDKNRELDSYESFYKLYESQNQFKTALNYHTKYASLKDSLFNQNKSQQIAEIVSQYEINKREQDIKILRQQRAIQEATNKRKNLVITFAILSVLGLLLFAIYLYRVLLQKKKTNLLLSQQNQEINQKQQQIITINKNLQKSQDQLHVVNHELQSMNAKLETVVKKRTSELQKTNQELDTFLYQSSHALRRPIVHVKGLVQLARLEPNQAEVVDLYDKLDDTATRMDLMLKKLVMASEIYVTKPEVETIYFEDIFKEIWQTLSESLKSENVSLEFNTPNGINYQADRRLVKIMFLNLLENAVLYNEATKRKKALVSITIIDNPNSIDVKVNDNGIGITEEAIAHIFDLFTVGTDQTKGYGLGLYIVKKAVEKLQGLITVSSKRSQFTTFHITLPKNPDIS